MKLLLLLLFTLPFQLIAQSSDSEALTFLKTNRPEIHAAIIELKVTDPTDYRNALDHACIATADHARIVATGDTSAAAAYLKMYQIDFDAIGVADELAQTTDEAKKETLTQELRVLIDASFSQWALVEQARIKRLEKELAMLKVDLQKKISDRKNVVESDAQLLIREAKEDSQKTSAK